MRLSRFYSPKPLTVGKQIELDPVARQHAITVLRLKPGAPLILFDGQGGEYRAVLREAGSRALAEILAHAPVERESPLDVTLLQGISRGERMDVAIQKAVELGVARILPVFTARSQVKLDARRAEKRLAHWRGVVRAACEQCGRNRLPAVAAPAPLSQVLAALPDTAARFVLAPEGGTSLASAAPRARIALLVGPEGGLEADEIRAATARGFISIGLGPRVLRTETAAAAALAAMQMLWGDFRQASVE